MTIAEILSNEELRQHEFPVAKNKIFLAHAGVCPLPRRVAQAMNDCANEATLGDQEEFVMHRIEDARKAGAQLLNCQPDEVSLVGPTSLALSFVASGLNFRKGDNILIYHDDYPSNVYPWMALAEKGVKVRLLNIRNLGAIRKVDVMGQVDEDTKLVALASNHFISGHRLDHDGIGSFLRERGVLFCRAAAEFNLVLRDVVRVADVVPAVNLRVQLVLQIFFDVEHTRAARAEQPFVRVSGEEVHVFNRRGKRAERLDGVEAK